MAHDTDPRIIRLQEYATCQTDALTVDQALALREQFSRYLTVQPAWVPGAWELTAGEFVGTVALDDLQVVIEPKLPVDNLFFMLSYAYELPEFWCDDTSLAHGEDVFEAVVAVFAGRVEQLVRRGLAQTYIEHEGNQPYLRGRLLLAPHLRQSAINTPRFYQRSADLTPDVLENRILKSTLSQLARFDYRTPDLRRRVRRALRAFARASLTPVAPSDCDCVVYTRLNASYRTPINLARLLLQHLSVEGSPGRVPFAAYLLDMDRVFELFVARFLESHFSGDPAIQVDIQPAVWLDAEGRERGVPDIILRRNGQAHLVLDTKYKAFGGQPAPEDRNQVLMYCHALGIAKGLLVYAGGDPQRYQRTFPPVVLSTEVLSPAGSLAEFRRRCQAFADSLVDGTNGLRAPL